MSKWPGKYIIGLTGNIATGKSVVRRMLEHLGAYTIDADALAHRAIAKDAPGYKPVLETFGKWILGSDGQIKRSKLGGLVFRDPEALEKLENIVHPLVEQAIEILVQRASQRVVVIEAIKLIESPLRAACDSIWVTYAPEEIQIERLMRKRNFSHDEAVERIHSQGAQSEKIERANTVIRNTSSYDELWKQVTSAWKQVSPTSDTMPVIMKKAKAGDFSVQRGRPRDSDAIADIINRLSQSKQKMSKLDVMEAFGEKAFLLLQLDGQVVGLAGWQVENLVARTTDLYIEPEHMSDKALETLVTEVERASKDLQCEASLIFPLPDLASYEDSWKKLGYEPRTPEKLGVQAWQDAALESTPPGTELMFKQLRVDRVLRPI
ncbi:MAG: dephospho-CoA kinase [Anaerolineales bacterium]|nr:dephospho-CoA kinase [Anaerolineales bacterium]